MRCAAANRAIGKHRAWRTRCLCGMAARVPRFSILAYSRMPHALRVPSHGILRYACTTLNKRAAKGGQEKLGKTSGRRL